MLPTGSRILPDVSFLTAIWTEILPFQDILFYLQQQVSNQLRLDRFFTSLSDLSWVLRVKKLLYMSTEYLLIFFCSNKFMKLMFVPGCEQRSQMIFDQNPVSTKFA